MTDNKRPEALRIEVTVGAPVETVWQALRDPEQIRRWHGWHLDDGGLEAEIELIYGAGAREGERPYVLEVQPDDVFELETVEEGTLVRIIRSEPDPTTEWAAYFDDVTEGWTSFLQQLRFYVERHLGEDRRTLFFDTDSTAGGIDRLLATSPAGAGAEWFAAPHQKGVVVDDLGPGLLVVGVKPGEAKGAMAILTTYGLDDERFAATRTAWDRWWQELHPGAAAAAS